MDGSAWHMHGSELRPASGIKCVERGTSTISEDAKLMSKPTSGEVTCCCTPLHHLQGEHHGQERQSSTTRAEEQAVLLLRPDEASFFSSPLYRPENSPEEFKKLLPDANPNKPEPETPPLEDPKFFSSMKRAISSKRTKDRFCHSLVMCRMVTMDPGS